MAKQDTLLCWILIIALASCPANSAAQSTLDLDPPVQANPNSSQATMSPDPNALPVFRLATTELDGDGNVTIATQTTTQTMVASLPKTAPPEFDPHGIRYTENLLQNYTVEAPYTEKDKDMRTSNR